MNWRRLGWLAALAAAFTAGTKAGIKYAQDHYVVKDRKFIEGEITPKKEDNRETE